MFSDNQHIKVLILRFDPSTQRQSTCHERQVLRAWELNVLPGTEVVRALSLAETIRDQGGPNDHAIVTIPTNIISVPVEWQAHYQAVVQIGRHPARR